MRWAKKHRKDNFDLLRAKRSTEQAREARRDAERQLGETRGRSPATSATVAELREALATLLSHRPRSV